MFACYSSQVCSRGEQVHKIEEKMEIGSIRDNGVVGKPSLSKKVVKEEIQVFGKGIAAQGLWGGLN